MTRTQTIATKRLYDVGGKNKPTQYRAVKRRDPKRRTKGQTKIIW